MCFCIGRLVLSGFARLPAGSLQAGLLYLMPDGRPFVTAPHCILDDVVPGEVECVKVEKYFQFVVAFGLHRPANVVFYAYKASYHDVMNWRRFFSPDYVSYVLLPLP